MSLLAAAAGALLALAAAPYLAYLGLFARLRPTGSPVEGRPREPDLSVVLPTYDEATIVEGKLAALCEQDYPLDRVEVVVVDASEDDTKERVRAFFEDREAPSLTLLAEAERRGVAAAVNAGVAAAAGEVVVRTDCDSRLAPGTFARAAAVLGDDAVGAVTGRQTEVLGDSAVEADYRDLLSLVQAVETHLDSTFVVHGPCFAFRADDYVPVDEDALADDTEAAVLIRRAGGRVVMDPALAFAESGTSRFRERRRRKDRRAMGLVQTLVRHRDALGRYGRYGRAVLPLSWWTMVAGPWLLVGALVAGTAAAVARAGPAGLALPAAVAAFAWLGQAERLGPLQPAHAVLDSQASLLVATVRLAAGGTDGTWTVDRSSREAFE